MGGRKEMVNKLKEINEDINRIEENIKNIRYNPLDENDMDNLEESNNNLGKYLHSIKLIERNIAELTSFLLEIP